MSKIKYEALNSANVRINNSTDVEKVYDIEANVNVSSNNVVSSIDSGKVTDNGIQKATFNFWGENMNINYTSVDAEEQSTILRAINSFITEVKQTISEG